MCILKIILILEYNITKYCSVESRCKNAILMMCLIYIHVHGVTLSERPSNIHEVSNKRVGHVTCLCEMCGISIRRF